MQSNRVLWIDYLRSFLTVLVVAHHAALAYTTFAHFDPVTYINSTHPVVDDDRSVALDIFTGFNDIFFMPLMYFISGLFTWPALQKKGRTDFIKSRFKRLGLPFIIAVTIIIPIAYLPSFYLVNHNWSLPMFIKDYILHQQWPVGPPWFIWILLLFNCIAVLIPPRFFFWLNNILQRLLQHPKLLLVTAYSLTAIVYSPVSAWLGRYTWTGFGPFDFQLNRLPLYFAFFTAGLIVSAGEQPLKAFNGKGLLNQRWYTWVLAAGLIYALTALFSANAERLVQHSQLTATSAWLIFDALFIASCLSTCLAFLAFFKETINTRSVIGNALSGEAFGIYLFHYVAVTWLQFALLDVHLPAAIKFFMVFTCSGIASYCVVCWLKKWPLFKGFL